MNSNLLPSTKFFDLSHPFLLMLLRTRNIILNFLNIQLVNRIVTLLFWFSILVLTFGSLWLGLEIYQGFTPIGIETEISAYTPSKGGIVNKGIKVMPLGMGRYRVGVDKFSNQELKISFKSNKKIPQLLMLRKGYDILGGPAIANLKVAVSVIKEGHQKEELIHSTEILGSPTTFTPRTFVLLPDLKESDQLNISIRSIDSEIKPNSKLILDEIGLYEDSSGFSEAYIRDFYNDFLVKILKGMMIFCTLLLLLMKRQKAIIGGILYVFALSVTINCLLLTNLFSPESQRDLRVNFASGTLQEFGGSNLNYGLHLASNILKGKGPVIQDMPPWHRMPGYGYFIALAGNANNLLEMAMNAVFLQVLVTAASLAFFFWSAVRIMPVTVAALISTIIACLPNNIYYLQIESMIPAILLFCAGTACLYIARYNKNKTVPIKYHLLLHLSFALWFLFRPDVAPGWFLVSLLMYGKHWRLWKYLLIPLSMFLIIGVTWGNFKQSYTGEFSMTTNSVGASSMVGLWETPHKFIWDVSDRSYFEWLKNTHQKSLNGLDNKEILAVLTRKSMSNFAVREVMRFWITYPGYMVSLVWHKFMVYVKSSAWPGLHINLISWQKINVVFLLTIISLSLALKYKRFQTLLLGWALPFNLSIFLLVFTSAGRFHNAPSMALLLATVPLLLDTGFYRRILSRPMLAVVIIMAGLIVNCFGQTFDEQLLTWDKFRYWAPILDPKDSLLSKFKPVEDKVKGESKMDDLSIKYLFNISNFELVYDKASLSKLSPNGLNKERVLITTAPLRLSYAARLKVPEEIKNCSKAILSIDLTLRSGGIVIGILSNDEKQFLVNSPVMEIPWWKFTAENKQIDLSMDSLNAAGFIVVSAGEDNRKGVVEINSVQLKKCE